jgi:N-carbamoylputrescine amidase
VDVFGTRIGVGICWDQWYPECARAMALMGAEMLFYPTAIGTEPYNADLDTSRMWRRAMQGHAVSNCMPVIAANRIGAEAAYGGPEQSYYGHSFISDEWGDLTQEFGAVKPACWSKRSTCHGRRRTVPAWAFPRPQAPALWPPCARYLIFM